MQKKKKKKKKKKKRRTKDFETTYAFEEQLDRGPWVATTRKKGGEVGDALPVDSAQVVLRVQSERRPGRPWRPPLPWAPHATPRCCAGPAWSRPGPRATKRRGTPSGQRGRRSIYKAAGGLSRHSSAAAAVHSIMKVLVVLSAVLAVCVATPGYLSAPALLARGIAAPGILAAHAPAVIAAAPAVVRTIPPGGPANIVIGPGGVPLDTPEVAAAKASHAAAVAETRARDAVVNTAPAVVAAAAPAAIAAAPAVIAARTPAATVLAGHGLLAPAAALRYAAAVPALRYAAVAPAALGYAAAHTIVAPAPIHPGYAAYGPANIVIGPGGVPLDTPEVAAGKVADAVAHLEAKARNGVLLG
ncbi:cuticle protein 18.7-like [Schistocerca serialis cubense]|uniref:cuticle protein 18.7-like n=1 Tax=Schistocerca serialis cubense TaxID=2023355 RepID=UPI00214EC230|nr:cuticle protein 18.7-like [Schistocerca serialis cubense]